jgi:ABC-2 type transport system permease protein
MVPARKIWRLFLRYVAIEMAAESEFRTDFFAGLLLSLSNAAMLTIFWDGLLRAAGPLPGWGMGELVLMSGLRTLAGVVGYVFFRMSQLPGKVLRGELDRYLTKPAPAFLCLQWEVLPLRSLFVESVSGAIVIAAAIFGWGFALDIRGVVPGLLLLILGSLIQTCFQTSVAALSFWMGRVDGLQAVLGEAEWFRRFPVTLFDRPVQVLLTWVWSFGLVMTYPVLLMRGELALVWPLLGGGAAVLAGWGLLLSWVLSAGLRRYESNGG